MSFRSTLLGLLCSTAVLSGCVVSDLNFREGIQNFQVQNYRQAFIHLKPEAIKGRPDAQYAVGYMYFYGQGVVEDKKQAIMWIRSAASKGQPDAIEAVKILAPGPVIPQRPEVYGAY